MLFFLLASCTDPSCNGTYTSGNSSITIQNSKISGVNAKLGTVTINGYTYVITESFKDVALSVEKTNAGVFNIAFTLKYTVQGTKVSVNLKGKVVIDTSTYRGTLKINGYSYTK